ncbi:Rpp14/Pop5 family protein [Aeropyrum pernix]|uniref:Rpp14/Pop5 family protein n=1 Tax=Aeropyrum pernix TaxID=56636 RepID=UPI000005DE2F|nr:Rpp14/Pop5 family protein [Aeropyrum pernix]
MPLDSEVLAAALAGLVAGGVAGLLASGLYVVRLRRLARILSRAALRQRELVRLRRLAGRRPRRRYVAFEVLSLDGPPPGKGEFEEALRGVYLKAFGAESLALARPRIVYYEEESGRGVVAVVRDYRYHILAALGLVRMAGGRRVLVVPLRTSGTVKGALRAFRSPGAPGRGGV